MIIWHPNKTQKCKFITAFIEEVLLICSTIIIYRIHSMLTFNNTTIRNFRRKLILTDQNLAFKIIKKSKITPKWQLYVANEETADLQYLKHLHLTNLRKLAVIMSHNNKSSKLHFGNHNTRTHLLYTKITKK